MLDRILLTNDDGIYAPGLRALRRELLKLGDVTVAAPATEQSAVGHSITLLTPLVVQEILDEDKKFLGWALTEGQKEAPDLKYAPLPAEVVQKETAQIQQIQVP